MFSSKFKIVVLSGHVTDDVIAMKVIKMYLAWKYLPTYTFVLSSHLMQRQIRTCTQTPTFSKLYLAPLIFIFCLVPGQSEMPHNNVLQAAMTAFSVTKYLRHSEQKRTS